MKPCAQERHPERTGVWRRAVACGAAVSRDVREARVTHVVARLDGTDKVRAARARGLHVVKPQPVEISAEHIFRSNTLNCTATAPGCSFAA